MRRIAFYVALVFALMTAWAVAEEKTSAENGAKKDAPSQTTESQKVESNAQATKTEASPEKVAEKPVQPKLDEDGLYQIEKNIVEFTNKERVRRGLKPLAIDKKLVVSARDQTQWMTKTRRLEHTRKPVGENIAMGYRTSKDVVRGWMNSSGHRANILNSGYRRIGVAAFKAKDGTVWWCQQFLR